METNKEKFLKLVSGSVEDEVRKDLKFRIENREAIRETQNFALKILIDDFSYDDYDEYEKEFSDFKKELESNGIDPNVLSGKIILDEEAKIKITNILNKFKGR